MLSTIHLAGLLLAYSSICSAHGGDGETAKSMTIADYSGGFTRSKIVPDVLAAFSPSVSFYAGYKFDDGDDALLMPGLKLTAAEAAAPSEFSVENIANATNVTSTSKFLIYMIGPDSPSASNPTGRNFRHYLAGNFSVSSTKSSILSTAVTLTNSSAATNEYAAPAPAAGSGSHRYIYLLYVQPSRFNTAGFESVGLNVSNRLNFNLSSFRTQAGLGPAIGGTYFTIDASSNSSNAASSGHLSAASPSTYSTVALFLGFLVLSAWV